MKTELIFHNYLTYENGKMAEMETAGETNIPVNVFAEENSDLKLREGTVCSVEIYGDFKLLGLFENEKAVVDSDMQLAPISMIPTGTFPSDQNDKKFKESPTILFCGRVQDVDYDENADDDNANYLLTVETLELNLKLFLRYDGDIRKENYVYGFAWLYGDILSKDGVEDAEAL